MDIAASIKFQDICKMLEVVKKAAGPAKEKYIRRYYDSFKKHRLAYRQQNGIAESAEEKGETSFYCILRCLVPVADTARKPYGLQISTLGRVYIKVLQLAPDSRDAERLQHTSYSGIHGDYGDVVHSVLVARCQNQGSNLTLKDVHDMLDTIATDDRGNTEKVLTRLSEIASPKEQMWFIRLLLKKMHLNYGEQRIFALLHPQAKDLYQRCSNLKRVCCLLADDKITINQKSGAPQNQQAVTLNMNEAIEPFQAIRPMLCEIFPGDIQPLMAADMLYMETKMDGERFQLHFSDGRFKFISRNGIDYTYSFGESYETGSLTPRLANLLPIGLESIILDGEMMVWDIENSRFRDKGEQTDVKHLGKRPGEQPCFVVYDLLYLNGRSLLDMPYAQRTFKLREIIKEQEGVLQTMKPQMIPSLDEFKKMFQAALDHNEEGVVLKKQNSVYRPGVRQGGGWFKVKADYIKGLTTEFDLLIMGGYYNQTRSYIESFLLGVLKYDSPTQFKIYSVGKVTNRIRQRAVLGNMLKPYWRDVSSDAPPMWYYYSNNTSEGRPDVWLDPTKSTILQIKAADLAPSSGFALPKALHFPRIEAWRNDKVWHECMTLTEYLQMCENKRGIKKINKRQLSEADFTTERKRYKLTPAEKRKIGLKAYEDKVNPDEVEKTTSLLEGYCFCILSGAVMRELSTVQLKKLVISNGGKVVENPKINDASCICIAGDKTYRVELMMKKRCYNIARASWLEKVCEQQKIQIRPQDLLSAQPEFQKGINELFDVYGDSFTDPINMSELKDILNEISEENVQHVSLSDEDVLKLETKLFKDRSPHFFRGYQACFYGTDAQSQLAELLFKWRGGTSIAKVENETQLKLANYILVNPSNTNGNDFKMWLKSAFADSLHKLKVVSIDWVISSDHAAERYDVNEYTWHDF